MDTCLWVLEKRNKSRFDSYSVRNSVWTYPILPFGIVACTFFSTTFLEIAVYRFCFTTEGVSAVLLSFMAFWPGQGGIRTIIFEKVKCPGVSLGGGGDVETSIWPIHQPICLCARMPVLEWKERAFIEKVNSKCFCFSAAIR